MPPPSRLIKKLASFSLAQAKDERAPGQQAGVGHGSVEVSFHVAKRLAISPSLRNQEDEWVL